MHYLGADTTNLNPRDVETNRIAMLACGGIEWNSVTPEIIRMSGQMESYHMPARYGLNDHRNYIPPPAIQLVNVRESATYNTMRHRLFEIECTSMNRTIGTAHSKVHAVVATQLMIGKILSLRSGVICEKRRTVGTQSEFMRVDEDDQAYANGRLGMLVGLN